MIKKKGFTLLEITLVIVLLSILMVITTPLVSNVINRTELISAHESLYNALLRAQTLSKNQENGQQWRVCINNTAKTYTLTSAGSCDYLTQVESLQVEVLIVAGGGAGGTTSSTVASGDGAGGGGAGGVITKSINNIATNQPYSVIVGAGGVNSSGGNSSAFGETAIGGGRGGDPLNINVSDGGSGGGAGSRCVPSNRTSGFPTLGQGYPGGHCTSSSAQGGSGGGGAGSAGTNAVSGGAGVSGGNGVTSSITGDMVYYAGGGGGGRGNSSGISGTGGLGGGGNGSNGTIIAIPGVDNTGSGGGGGGSSTIATTRAGARGGSGIVVVRYEGPQKATGGTVTSKNGYTIHQFTNVGESSFVPFNPDSSQKEVFTIPNNINITSSQTLEIPFTSIKGELDNTDDFIKINLSSGGFTKSIVVYKSGIIDKEPSTDPVSSTTTSSIVEEGLVLYLDAGNRGSYPGSGTTWTDLSASGNNGTLVNSPTYKNENGGGLEFGTGKRVDLASASLLPLGTTDRTIFTCVKPPGPSNQTTEINKQIIHWGTAAATQAFGLSAGRGPANSTRNNKLINNILSTDVFANPSQGAIPTNSNLITADKVIRYCITLTYTYANGLHLHKFWLNGISQGNGVSAVINTGNTQARIGAIIGTIGSNDWSGTSLQGVIYNVMVYNRALSDSEIQQNFNAFRGRFGL